MTVLQRIQQRGMPLSAGGWGGWMSDPAAIPPPSVYNQAIAGVIVNERTILSIMAVAACLRVLGDSSSGITVKVHRQTGNKRRFDDPEVDLPQVIYDPCADIDREQKDFNCVASWGLNGNAYYHIIDRDKSGNPLQLEVLNPSQVKVNMIKGNLVYKMGSDISPPIPTKDIVHIPWMSLAGGVVGLNPIEIGAVGFGGGIAANEYASRFFAQGIHPTGLLSIEKPIRQADKERVVTELMTKHGGLAQSHTPIVLDSNAKWMQISVNPATAQLLESRSFTRQEVAGFYGVPPHLIGDVASSEIYGTGLQEMVMGFAMFALSGYTRRLDRMDTKLLPAGYYVRRDCAELFRNTNDEAMGQFVAALRMNAIATPNEVRKFVRLPHSDEPGADSLWGPINSAHADFYDGTTGGAVPAPGTGQQPAPPMGMTANAPAANPANPVPPTANPAPSGQTGPNRSRLPLAGEGESSDRAFEDFQKTQGHGYHGWFEPGGGPKDSSPSSGPDDAQNAKDDQALQGVLAAPLPQGQPVHDMGWASVLAQMPKDGGFSVDPKDGSSPTTGFQVGGVDAPIELGTSDPVEGGHKIEAYVKAHPEMFVHGNMKVGGWTSPTGEFVVEASEPIDDKFKAVQVGMQRNQEGIWDNAEGLKDPDKGFIMTYGSGKHGQPNMNYDSKPFGSAIHDGYKPTGFAYSGTSVVGAIGMPTNMNTTSMQGLSAGSQKKIRQVAGAQGLTDEAIAGNIYNAIEKATPQQIADGFAAYSRYNAEAENIGAQSGISPRQAAAVIALLSPQTKLGSNIAMAHYLANAVATDKMISLDDRVVDAANAHYPGLGLVNNTKLSSQPSYQAQARAIMLMASKEKLKTDPQYGTTKASKGTQGGGVQETAGDDQMAAAIAVVRGVDEDGAETDIDRMLSGHKVRSFFNNINDPSDPRFVTVDGFMIGVGMGKSADDPYGAADGKIGRQFVSNPGMIADNAKGSYALFADGVRAASAKAALDHNIPLLPDQGQAIAWIAAGGGATKGIAGIPVVIPRPEPSTPQGEQLTLKDENPGVMGDFKVTSSKTITSADVLGYVGPTVNRTLVSQAEAKKEFERRMGYGPTMSTVLGVKATNGKIVLGIVSSRLQKKNLPEELWKVVPTDEQVQAMISTLADRYDHDDLGLPEAPIAYVLSPPEVVYSVGSAEQAASTMAWTTPTNPGLIKINGVNLATVANAATEGDNSFTMPVASQYGVSSQQYTITHEYGHLTEFAHDLYSGQDHSPKAQLTPGIVADMMTGKVGAGPKLLKGTFVKANKLAATLPAGTGMSEYGKSNAHEAYAEAFTEYTLTGGKTDNKVTQLYAKVFNWADSKPVPPGSNVSPIPGLSPIEETPGDNDMAVMLDKSPHHVDFDEMDRDEKIAHLAQHGLTSPNNLSPEDMARVHGLAHDMGLHSDGTEHPPYRPSMENPKEYVPTEHAPDPNVTVPVPDMSKFSNASMPGPKTDHENSFDSLDREGKIAHLAEHGIHNDLDHLSPDDMSRVHQGSHDFGIGV